MYNDPNAICPIFMEVDGKIVSCDKVHPLDTLKTAIKDVLLGKENPYYIQMPNGEFTLASGVFGSNYGTSDERWWDMEVANFIKRYAKWLIRTTTTHAIDETIEKEITFHEDRIRELESTYCDGVYTIDLAAMISIESLIGIIGLRNIYHNIIRYNTMSFLNESPFYSRSEYWRFDVRTDDPMVHLCKTYGEDLHRIGNSSSVGVFEFTEPAAVALAGSNFEKLGLHLKCYLDAFDPSPITTDVTDSALPSEQIIVNLSKLVSDDSLRTNRFFTYKNIYNPDIHLPPILDEVELFGKVVLDNYNPKEIITVVMDKGRKSDAAAMTLIDKYNVCVHYVSIVDNDKVVIERF